ncbi:unnamed protein product [Polarella glacialis]|uniref:Methyltransferase domain-containing protein n=1 Tax=Polarella glacialis TaxID=89957 RepID=A0A813KJ96_POLGL|nr:unnamed protein product [Polarella glacialis]CAE8705372.1 unnamed protein product [Polarella glacialis]
MIPMRNDFQRLPFNAGILWNDKATRAMLSTDLLSQLRLLHGRDLQVLDLGSGLRLNVIGALRSGQVKLAVGVDFDPGAVLQAHRNAAHDGVRNFHFLQAHICGSASELRARVRDQGVRGRVRFDVFTMTSMSSPLEVMNCAYELMFTLGAKNSVYIDSDTLGFHHLRDDIGYSHLPFQDFLDSKGYKAVPFREIDIRRTLGTDEELFPQIFPVKVWMFDGLEAL